MRSRPAPMFGLLLTLLALAMQLAVGAVVPQPQVGLALDELGIVICHASPAPGETPPATPHHAPACVLCPLCAAVTAPSYALASSGPHVPPPWQVTLVARAGLPPPATAPPVAPHSAAQPRGPPTLA